MKQLVCLLLPMFFSVSVMAGSIDYDKLVFLDAEALAEAGIKEAYEELLPELKRYVQNSVKIEERLDADQPRYSVVAAGIEYVVYAPGLIDEEGQSWGRATWAFFDIVNRQLTGSQYRFYAISGGNDLGGMFLTAAEVEEFKNSLGKKSDWPYLPTQEHPWYGQEH